MRNQWILQAVCAAILLTCTNSPQQAGTMSETDTAMIYNPDNTPAKGAVVKFFVATDSTRTIAYQTTTDSNGRYSTKALAKGMYNLLAYSAKGLAKDANDMSAANDSLIAYQDSILVFTDTVIVQPDTLEKPGSITGIIGLQPNHDPRTVTVEVLGTNIYSNVDINGRFTLSPVAKGNYNLRIVTILLDYTPTYVSVYTQGQKKDTLADTLWLTFTGIPVVTGLSASYDTANGLVHLSWNKAAYRDFQNYLVFRDAFDSINLSTNPIGACTDTFFVDTVFKRSLVSGKFSFSDTNDYHFKYRVCVENNSAKRGDTYKYAGIVAASPVKTALKFAITFFHIAKQFFTDSASINDSILCCVNISNPTRQLKSLVWTDVNAGKMVRTIALDSTKKTAVDTLKYSWNTIGGKRLVCVITDMAGTVWRDTANISIVKDAPVVTLTYSPATVTNNDTIHLHISAFDKYGKIVNFECDIGNTGQFLPGIKLDSVFDTAVVAPGMPNAEYLCVARVTDDDGNVVMDSLSVTINMFSLATKSTGFQTRFGHTSVVFNNKMWLISGDYCVINISDSWYSEDGISWLPATRNAPFNARECHASLVYDSKMWIIGGWSYMTKDMNDVWYSSDGTTWIQSTANAQFSPRRSHSSVLFDGKMWVIGGHDSSQTFNDVWYSTDGATWTMATGNAGFSPRSGHSSVVFDNKMWVIGGDSMYSSAYTNIYKTTSYNDVWYSTDGLAWIQATADAGFSPRGNHTSLVFDNKMWVIGGSGKGPNLFNDIWYSTDGVTWIQVTANAEFSPRAFHSSLVFNNKMWVIGGYDGAYAPGGEVWYSGFGGK